MIELRSFITPLPVALSEAGARSPLASHPAMLFDLLCLLQYVRRDRHRFWLDADQS